MSVDLSPPEPVKQIVKQIKEKVNLPKEPVKVAPVKVEPVTVEPVKVVTTEEPASNSLLLIILGPILGVLLLTMLVLGILFRHRLCKCFNSNITKVQILSSDLKT